MADPKSIKALNADLFPPEADHRFADPKRARKQAMDYLARRDYGQSELVNKLLNAGFDAHLAVQEVARLTDEGLQNDRRYAESFVQSRISQGKGPVRIRQELTQRGLPARTIDDALREAGQDWFELARQVRVRKFGAAPPEEFKEKARQMRFLQYRGFEQDHIQAAVHLHGDA
jgi:regulatory protein